MIVDAIISVLLAPIDWLIGLLPNIHINTDGASTSALIDTINSASCFVPVGTFFICMGLWLIITNFELLSSVINWIIRKIPMMN